MQEQTLKLKALWKPWFMAARPKTLTAAVVPPVLATFLAMGVGYSVSWWLTCAALLSSIAIQIGTNLVNDALDFKRGADTKTRLGPTRVTQQGLLTPRQVYFSGVAFFALAFILGIPLIMKGGWVIALIMTLSIISGYLYTGGPTPLAYHGLGDAFVILFFGLISTSAIYYVQTLTMDMKPIIAGLQIGLLCTVLIAINNLRDHEQDAKVHKNTLAVRFGVTFSRLEITALVLVPFLLTYYWYHTGCLMAAVIPWGAFPIANRLLRSIWTVEPSEKYNAFLGQAALLHLLFGLLLSLGFNISLNAL